MQSKKSEIVIKKLQAHVIDIIIYIEDIQLYIQHLDLIKLQ